MPVWTKPRLVGPLSFSLSVCVCVSMCVRECVCVYVSTKCRALYPWESTESISTAILLTWEMAEGRHLIFSRTKAYINAQLSRQSAIIVSECDSRLRLVKIWGKLYIKHILLAPGRMLTLSVYISPLPLSPSPRSFVTYLYLSWKQMKRYWRAFEICDSQLQRELLKRVFFYSLNAEKICESSICGGLHCGDSDYLSSLQLNVYTDSRANAWRRLKSFTWPTYPVMAHSHRNGCCHQVINMHVWTSTKRKIQPGTVSPVIGMGKASPSEIFRPSFNWGHKPLHPLFHFKLQMVNQRS